MKTKTIKLLDNNRSSGKLHYKIEQITDSVEYRPGEWLDKATVEGLCNSADWKVTIIAGRSK